MQILRIIIGIVISYSFVLKWHIEAIFNPTPPLQWKNGTKGDIILLYGWGERWTFFKKIGNYLNSSGYTIHIIKKIGFNFHTLEQTSTILEHYIQKHCLQNVFIITHSKGGLTAKYFLDNSTYRSSVKKVISIACPFQGTLFGHLYIGNLHELIMNSNVMKNLVYNTQNNHKFLNLYPSFDQHVLPNKNLLLNGAENKNIDVIGHDTILIDQRIIQTIQEVLS